MLLRRRGAEAPLSRIFGLLNVLFAETHEDLSNLGQFTAASGGDHMVGFSVRFCPHRNMIILYPAG